ncbi:PREDICTED: non-functional pseudokinase ZED1-like isoform X2 [Tarenaya hassleriana]|uniref:non-functional pseudokinase ZED1-like isoform X2 n=1 Tax=Tarenaya hassleriana TaxID=28532 RepID=UPI00053C1ECD|nr:PREDICTED: non-functional pseudokinase ZED1-like isoform X2 [Tarenaya hassleriana]
MDHKFSSNLQPERAVVQARLGGMDWWKRRSRRKKAKQWFLETGSAFLEELVAGCNVLNNTNGGNGGKDGPLLPWKLRVKIAKETAYAVTYLHKAFPRIIIHRDIMPWNIFLDNNWTAKLTGFSISISLPEGKSRAEDVIVGTYGYVDPRYMETGVVAESSDVFSFGTFFMVLLTGRPPFSSHGGYVKVHDYVKSIIEYGDMNEMMAEDMTDHQRSQMEVCLKLALRCCEDTEDDRPTMVQVTKELKQIETSLHATGPSQTLQSD